MILAPLRHSRPPLPRNMSNVLLNNRQMSQLPNWPDIESRLAAIEKLLRRIHFMIAIAFWWGVIGTALICLISIGSLLFGGAVIAAIMQALSFALQQ